MANVTAVEHPFYPFGVDLPGGFVANTLSSPVLVGSFAAGCTVILSTARMIMLRVNPKMSTGKLSTALWFVLCGFIHSFFEGYFAYNFHRMPTQTDLFGQMWKEYSLSDSRYLTQDSFVTCMEAVTAMFWGPLSFLIAYCITTDHPLRHPMTIIVSLGQLYGDVLYYATCTFSHVVDSISYCRPELFYFYMYYILLNAFWIVIPFGLMTQSVFASVSAFAQVQKAEQMKKGQ